MRRLYRYAPLWVGLLSLGISGLVALTTPLPQPQFHDEFSYLVAADTFAKGRLSNRPHELWEFFESFQIIQQPKYMSKYPPGQGLVLALGKAIFGHPIAGVWLSTAAACAAVWWGLRGIVPNRWALIGGFIAATHPLMLKWNWSYWGGAVAVIGGALVVGGLARFFHARTALRAAWLGLGLFILAISRPFEGVILVVLSLLLLRVPSPRPFPLPLRGIPGGRGGKMSAIAALAGMAVLGAAWIGYYNWRITGSPIRLPYLVYESQYAACPPFVWMPHKAPAPVYRHRVMADYYLEWELPQYRRARSEPMRVLLEKLWSFATNYLWSIALTIPLLMSILVARRRRLVGGALAVAAIFTLAVVGNLWFFPHYVAPAAAVYALIIVQGLRYLRALPSGRWIVRAVLQLHLIAPIVWFTQLDRSGGNWNYKRASLIEEARNSGEKLLVIVRPGQGYYPHNEWVYNDANIGESPVVWARDMGEQNQRLISYFDGRKVLFLDIDAQTMRFTEMRGER